MSAQSAEMQMKISLWRNKAREGTLTQDEMREAIVALRRDRGSVAQATSGSKVRKTATAKAKPNGDDLLSELEGI